MRILPAIAIVTALLTTSCKTDTDALGDTRALTPFYRALAASGAAPSLAAPGATLSHVAVLQIGDSHTANDGFSGRMRELMQARFGDGGRGLLAAGIPFAYYRPARVRVTAAGWTLARSGAEPPTPGVYGVTGLQQQAAPGGPAPATMTITAAPGELAHLSVEALGQQGGGTIDITTSDGKATTFPTAAAPSLLRADAPTTADTTWVTLTARADGPVGLLSWTATRPTPGLTWSNLGAIGATVGMLQRWDPTAVAADVGTLDPALIIVAFGTNEGFKDTTDLDAYPALLRSALRALHEAAPRAALMVAGPPAGVRATGRGTGTPCADPAWSVPSNLPRIREIERQVAAEENAWFWDWAATMGGDCGMVEWSQSGLAARDHVHLLTPGARRTAESLYATLMAGYDRYLKLANR